MSEGRNEKPEPWWREAWLRRYGYSFVVALSVLGSILSIYQGVLSHASQVCL